MLLALYFFAIYSLNREHALSGMADYLPLMPIFFALSLLTNRWCRSPRSRIAYRLSPLAAVPFLWADVGGWVHSVAYPVTLIVSALTVFAGGCSATTRASSNGSCATCPTRSRAG